MAKNDLDVDLLLEEPLDTSQKESRDAKHRKSSSSRHRDAKSSKRRGSDDSNCGDWSPSSGSSTDRRKSRRDRRQRSRSKSRSPTRRRRSRSKSREKRRHSRSRSRSKERRRKRSRSPREDRRRGRSPSPLPRGKFGLAEKHYPSMEEMTTEERDKRTVFCMQLAARTDERSLRSFFQSAGKIRDVRLIMDMRTRKHKGCCYVEFYDVESVPIALAMNEQKLNGAPIKIQVTQSEKNLVATTPNTTYVSANVNTKNGPMKLYVGNLHFNITEDMIRGIFEPFGHIDKIEMIKDNGRSRGYCFLTFRQEADARKAMEQLNGFELAGREIKVNYVTDHNAGGFGGRNLDSDEMDNVGMSLGATGRLHLMAKLAEGSGLMLPAMTQQLLQQQQTSAIPAISTQCFMLSNMFDPKNETSENWELEIRDDVISECARNGGIVHIFVDKNSPEGNVYCKAPSIAIAVACVNSLHGRLFAGKIITGNYVPVVNYHELFPDSVHALQPLVPT